uniref:Uncharacterized protein n=1 Tax=Helianthus annuus TaxID=4232 RepID=A0A251S596_HELAN
MFLMENVKIRKDVCRVGDEIEVFLMILRICKDMMLRLTEQLRATLALEIV